MNTRNRKIRPGERESIMQSLRSGLSPSRGSEYIRVGREKEINAMVNDLDRINDGGTLFRIIIGDFGSGKSFFMGLVRSLAQERGLVSIHADLSPERRLYGVNGEGRYLYRELMSNLSAGSEEDGASTVLEAFITEAQREAQRLNASVSEIMSHRLSRLSRLPGGYDFARVILLYWEGRQGKRLEMESNVLRWLRGEFATRTEARKALGIGTVIDDISLYHRLKLMGLFVRQAGYRGLLVSLDEMENLYKLPKRQARLVNYEQILCILNDCLQGSAEYMGFLLAGTPNFLLDPRRGLYSYEALKSRLAPNTFARNAGLVDYTSPILELNNLERQEMLSLIRNIRDLFASGDKNSCIISEEGLIAFLDHCSSRMGSAYFQTARNIVKAFTDLLSVLEQNPGMSWEDALSSSSTQEQGETEPQGQDDLIDELVRFRI